MSTRNSADVTGYAVGLPSDAAALGSRVLRQAADSYDRTVVSGCVLNQS
jgi:hypothetical protein